MVLSKVSACWVIGVHVTFFFVIELVHMYPAVHLILFFFPLKLLSASDSPSPLVLSVASPNASVLVAVGLVMSSPLMIFFFQITLSDLQLTKSYFINVHDLFCTNLGLWVIKVYLRFTLLPGLGLITIPVFT